MFDTEAVSGIFNNAKFFYLKSVYYVENVFYFKLYTKVY